MTIRQLVGEITLNDATLAVKLDVSPMTVYRWRKGRKVPTPAMRKVLCRLAGVSIEDVTWERTRG